MTFYEHRILLLQAMSISLREKPYTVAYIKITKAFNAIISVSALILKHGYLPTRFHQSVQNFCFSFTVEHLYGCVSEVTPRWYFVSWL